MAFKITDLLEKGEINKKRLIKILHDFDARITEATGSETSLAEDVSALKTTVGDADSGLVKGVADLNTTVGDSNSGLVNEVAGKADASHTHNFDIDITGYDVVEVTVTYTDDSTDTLYLVKVQREYEPTQQEPEGS